MSIKVIKGIGKAAEKILGELVGKSSGMRQSSGSRSENISDLIIDNITDVIGGGGQGRGGCGGL